MKKYKYIVYHCNIKDLQRLKKKNFVRLYMIGEWKKNQNDSLFFASCFFLNTIKIVLDVLNDWAVFTAIITSRLCVKDVSKIIPTKTLKFYFHHVIKKNRNWNIRDIFFRKTNMLWKWFLHWIIHREK